MRTHRRYCENPVRTFYYDATSGSDTNTGQADRPLQTMADLSARAIRPGERVLLKRGCEWYEQIVIPTSGKSGRPITFADYSSGALPKLNGSTLMTGWTNESGNIYKVNKTQTDHARLGVWEDGVRLARMTSLGAVIAAGQYYFSGTVLYVWCTDNADPSTHVMEFTKLGFYPVETNGKNYLTFKNIESTKGSGSSFNVRTILQHDVFFTGCVASWSNMRGFDLGMTTGQTDKKYNIFVTDCIAHDCLGEGFWVGNALNCGMTYSTLYNNRKDVVASKGYTTFPDVAGAIIGQGTTDCYVKWCSLRAEGYGASVNRAVLMCENEVGGIRPVGCVFDGNTCVDEGGSCYDEGDGTIIRNNVMIGRYYNASVIYCTDGSTNTLIYNNTIINTRTGSGGIYIGSTAGTNHTIKNNLIRNVDTGYGIWLDSWDGVVIDHNHIFDDTAFKCRYNSTNYTSAGTWEAATGATNTTVGDSLFVNYATEDLHLSVGSPCIGAGVNGLVTYDKDLIIRGAATDIGAYEYV